MSAIQSIQDGRRMDHITGVVGEVMQLLVMMRPLRETLDFIARRVCECLAFKYAAILLPEDTAGQMRIEGSYGLDERYIREVNLRRKPKFTPGLWSESPSIRAYQSGRTVIISDVRHDPSFKPWLSLAEEYGYRSLVSIPMVLRGDPIGVLNVYSPTVRTYSLAEQQILQVVATQAALAIELARLLLEQKQSISRLRELAEALRREQEATERVSAVRQHLIQLVMNSAGQSAILQALAERLDAPVLAWDRRQSLMAWGIPSASPITKEEIEVWSRWIEHPTVSARLAQCVSRGELVRIEPSKSEGRTNAVAVVPVPVGHDLPAYLGLIEVQGQPPEWVYRALTEGAGVLALELMKHKMIVDTEERLKADFLHSLLTGDVKDWNRAAERAQMYGIDPTVDYMLMLIDVDESGRVDSRVRVRLNEQVSHVLSHHLSLIATTVVRDVIVAIYKAKDPKQGAEKGRLAGRALRDHVKRTMAQTKLFIALSGPCRHLADFQSAFQDGKAMLAIAREYGRCDQILTVQDMSLFRLLLRTHDPGQMIKAAELTLGELATESARSGLLFETLVAYLENNQDVQACATALAVHPNTVRYRLNKVEQLTGKSLSKPSDVLQLTFAVTVLRLIRSSH
ncbi:helix-turn-helix domain-containing protein [Thermaerobacter composti]|uniref:Helix-turn-helix domain-containing protein n=1 Tax=Thermaerobacter composti TaxID=554949 RepID=A0ABZ0QLZ6_9FIRM|nr:GAF domain-containing protein [Thermaerobacter composti]WPD18520.1 helix-turn-helix domain-containing protein [Thermaerobacter composti]